MYQTIMHQLCHVQQWETRRKRKEKNNKTTNDNDTDNVAMRKGLQ